MNLTYTSRLLGLIGIGLFIASAFTPLPNVLSRRLGTPAQLGPAQAIVVLGGGLWPEGLLGNSSLRRALHGIALYRQGLASILVFLGEERRGPPAEATVRAELARQFGIPPSVILTETRAWTTREEAVRVEALLRSKGVRKILLVTDSHHMSRAQKVFENVGFEVLAAPADDLSSASESPGERLRLMHWVLRELAARFYYRLAGYL